MALPQFRLLTGNWQNPDEIDLVDEALTLLKGLRDDHLAKSTQDSRKTLLKELQTAGDDTAKRLQAALRVAQELQKKKEAAKTETEALSVLVQELQDHRLNLLTHPSEATIAALTKREQQVSDELSEAGRTLIDVNTRLALAAAERKQAEDRLAADKQNAADIAAALTAAAQNVAAAAAAAPAAPAAPVAPAAPMPAPAAAAPAAPVPAAPAPAAPSPAAAPAVPVASSFPVSAEVAPMSGFTPVQGVTGAPDPQTSAMDASLTDYLAQKGLDDDARGKKKR